MLTKEVPVLLDGSMEAPAHQTSGSAGVDLRSNERIMQLNPGESHLFGTGIRAEIPEGFVLLIFSRSGLSFKRNLILPNGVGVIDSDYRGEIMVGLKNIGKDVQFIKEGERIAQAVLLPYFGIEFKPVDKLSDTERGEGGFGSTGIE